MLGRTLVAADDLQPLCQHWFSKFHVRGAWTRHAQHGLHLEGAHAPAATLVWRLGSIPIDSMACQSLGLAGACVWKLATAVRLEPVWESVCRRSQVPSAPTALFGRLGSFLAGKAAQAAACKRLPDRACVGAASLTAVLLYCNRAGFEWRGSATRCIQTAETIKWAQEGAWEPCRVTSDTAYEGRMRAVAA
jgi:hypothetical protein